MQLKGKIHCEISLSEYFMKYLFNVNFTVYLNIKFQLKCFSKLSWNISVKEISFNEILLQKKPPLASLVLLFQLHNKEEIICKYEKRVL